MVHVGGLELECTTGGHIDTSATQKQVFRGFGRLVMSVKRLIQV